MTTTRTFKIPNTGTYELPFIELQPYHSLVLGESTGATFQAKFGADQDYILYTLIDLHFYNGPPGAIRVFLKSAAAGGETMYCEVN